MYIDFWACVIETGVCGFLLLSTFNHERIMSDHRVLWGGVFVCARAEKGLLGGGSGRGWRLGNI
jgi:hypothetical protein